MVSLFRLDNTEYDDLQELANALRKAYGCYPSINAAQFEESSDAPGRPGIRGAYKPPFQLIPELISFCKLVSLREHYRSRVSCLVGACCECKVLTVIIRLVDEHITINRVLYKALDKSSIN